MRQREKTSCDGKVYSTYQTFCIYVRDAIHWTFLCYLNVSVLMASLHSTFYLKFRANPLLQFILSHHWMKCISTLLQELGSNRHCVKHVFYLLSSISQVICYTGAEISSQCAECLKQCGPQLSENSSPLRDTDVYLNSLRLTTELWDSALLFHVGSAEKLLALRFYNACRNTSSCRNVMGIKKYSIATVPWKKQKRATETFGEGKQNYSLVWSQSTPPKQGLLADFRTQPPASWHKLYSGRCKVFLSVSPDAGTCSTFH